MSKKIMLIALSSIMALTLFSSCWGKDDSSSSSSMSSSSSRPSVSSSMLPDMDSSDSLYSSSSGGSLAPSSMPSSMPSGTASSGASSVKPMSDTSSTAAANAAAAGDLWCIRLVNAATPLPEDFTVNTVNIKGYDDRLFDARAAEPLAAMLSDAKRAGHELYLVSSYRSIARQKALFARKTAYYTAKGETQSEAELLAAKWVARPGTSEHNIGLAADIVSKDWYKTNSDLTAEFDQTDAYSWLSANAVNYGFILRYPKGKESITGISYEPWHYRYVGQEAATEITKAGLCLEEYVSNKGL